MEREYIDVSGVVLKPGNMRECAGNGKFIDGETGEKIECCCDNCDFFIECILKTDFPEFEDIKKDIISLGWYLENGEVKEVKEKWKK